MKQAESTTTGKQLVVIDFRGAWSRVNIKTRGWKVSVTEGRTEKEAPLRCTQDIRHIRATEHENSTVI